MSNFISGTTIGGVTQKLYDDGFMILHEAAPIHSIKALLLYCGWDKLTDRHPVTMEKLDEE